MCNRQAPSAPAAAQAGQIVAQREAQAPAPRNSTVKKGGLGTTKGVSGYGQQQQLGSAQTGATLLGQTVPVS